MAPMAQESDHVKRAREKLKRQFDEENKKITPQALKEVQDRIYKWIERHSRERINLRDKNIALYTLFDSNANPAKTTSKFIERLRTQLSQELAEEPEKVKKALHALRGRIKPVVK